MKGGHGGGHSIGPTGVAPPTSAWPGQAGNLVGHLYAPGYSSLTAWPGGTGAQTISSGTNAQSGSGTAADPYIFSFYDFDALTSGTVISLNNCIFKGCRFQSNSVGNANVQTSGANITFSYCSFIPRVAIAPTIPNAGWPSAGAGTTANASTVNSFTGVISGTVLTVSGGVTGTAIFVGQYITGTGVTAGTKINSFGTGSGGNGTYNLNISQSASSTMNGSGTSYIPYMISGDNGYQYGVNIPSGGPVTFDHCDIWGFGNAITFQATTAQMVVSSCWIHDAANPDQQSYHTDGPGYLNGATPPQNISITGCTIATIGNTNAISFQTGSSGYSNISVVGNYMSGFGNTVDMCHNTSGNNNLRFTDNVLSTDLQWVYGPLYTDFTTQFTGSSNIWRRNTFKVRTGTSPASGSSPSWTSADDGKYVLPNNTLSSSDFAG